MVSEVRLRRLSAVKLGVSDRYVVALEGVREDELYDTGRGESRFGRCEFGGERVC